MKSRLSFLLAVIVLICLPLSFADENMTAWQWFLEVNPPAGAQGLCSVTLTAEALEQARTDLADLRLVDGKGREVPLAARVRRDIDEVRQIDTREFNRAKAAGGVGELAVQLSESGEHNEAEIATEGQNFRRQVELDGSDDGRSWRVLKSDGAIFRFEANSRSVESNRLNYPVSQYRFLRARVSSDPLVDKSAPVVTTISVMMSVREKGEQITWDVDVPVHDPVRAGGSPASAWLLDLGHRVPVNHLTLDIRDQSFSRPFTIEQADDPQNPGVVASGEIQQRGGDERKPITLSFDEVQARRLRLIVTDYANPPLGIDKITASAPARQALFELKGAVTPPLRMFVGNESADAPRYDFEKELPRQPAVEPSKCLLGSIELNPDFRPEPKPLTERVPWLIYVVLAVSSVALGWILLSLVRSMQSITGNPPRETPQ